MGIFISQYKDPYEPTSIMESRRVFFVCIHDIIDCFYTPKCTVRISYKMVLSHFPGIAAFMNVNGNPHTRRRVFIMVMSITGKGG